MKTLTKGVDIPDKILLKISEGVLKKYGQNP